MSIHDIPTEAREDRSLGELFADLTRETSNLIRQEALLAKVEFGRKAGDAAREAGVIATGGAIAYTGLVAITAAIVLGLIQAGMQAWTAALLVGAIAALVGGTLIWMGVRALRNTDWAHRQTLATMKEDVKWVQRETR